MNKQMLYDLDTYLDEHIDLDWTDWWGDVADMVEIVENCQRVEYGNFNTIQFDNDANLGKRRLKSIYADNKEAWMSGRIEFLESVIKRELGDSYFDEHCKEID